MEVMTRVEKRGDTQCNRNQQDLRLFESRPRDSHSVAEPERTSLIRDYLVPFVRIDPRRSLPPNVIVIVATFRTLSLAQL